MTSTHPTPRPVRPRRWLACAAALSLALTGAACSSGGDGGGAAGGDEQADLTLAFWGDTSRDERYGKVIEAFEAQNEGVTIERTFAGWGDYWTARNTEAAGRSLPDVLQLDLAYVNQYARNGQLVELDQYIGQTIDTSTINEQLLASGQVEGTTYAISSSSSTMATFVNEALLEELGVEAPAEDLTWDQYDAFLDQVSEAGASQDPQVWGGSDYTQVFWLFQMWLSQQGLTLLDESGQLGFTQADLQRWWDRGEALREAEAVVPQATIEQLSGADTIGSGATATEISWDNFLTRFSEGSAEPELSMMAIPSGEGTEAGMFLKPGLMMGVAANSEHPDEAAAFIDFLINSEEAGEIFGSSRGLPSSSTALGGVSDEGLDAQLVEYETSVESELTGSAPPPVEGFATLEEAFNRISQDVAFDASSSADAAAQWFTEAEAALGGS